MRKRYKGEQRQKDLRMKSGPKKVRRNRYKKNNERPQSQKINWSSPNQMGMCTLLLPVLKSNGKCPYWSRLGWLFLTGLFFKPRMLLWAQVGGMELYHPVTIQKPNTEPTIIFLSEIFLFTYLFIWECVPARESTNNGRDKGRSRPPADQGALWGELDPGILESCLSPRQTINWATRVPRTYNLSGKTGSREQSLISFFYLSPQIHISDL